MSRSGGGLSSFTCSCGTRPGNFPIAIETLMRLPWIQFLITPLLLVSLQGAAGQGTVFTYQGRLNDSGSLANGRYDLTFALYDSSTSGNLVSGTLTNLATPVSNGVFTTSLDFGSGM